MDEQQLNEIADKVYARVVAKLAAAFAPQKAPEQPDAGEQVLTDEEPALLPDSFDDAPKAEPKMEGFVKHLMTKPVLITVREDIDTVKLVSPKVTVADMLTNIVLEGREYGVANSMPIDLVIGDKTYCNLTFTAAQGDEERIEVPASLINE